MPDEKIEMDVPSTQQRDLEARNDPDYQNPFFVHKTVNPGDTQVPTEDGFVGVDPIYQNYANETDAPLQAEEGIEKVVEEKAFQAAQDNLDASAEAEKPAEENKVEEKPKAIPSIPPRAVNESNG